MILGAMERADERRLLDQEVVHEQLSAEIDRNDCGRIDKVRRRHRQVGQAAAARRPRVGQADAVVQRRGRRRPSLRGEQWRPRSDSPSAPAPAALKKGRRFTSAYLNSEGGAHCRPRSLRADLERVRRGAHRSFVDLSKRAVFRPWTSGLRFKASVAASRLAISTRPLSTIRILGEWLVPFPDSALTLIDPPFRVERVSPPAGAVVLDHVQWWTAPAAMAPELSVARAVSRRYWERVIDTRSASVVVRRRPRRILGAPLVAR